MSSAEQCLHVAGREFSPWGKKLGLSTSLHIFRGIWFLCVPYRLCSEKLVCGGWLAQEVREPHTTAHQAQLFIVRHGGEQSKVWRCEGSVKTHHLLRLLWSLVEVRFDGNPAATCWTDAIKYVLFPSLPRGSVISISEHRCSVCSRDAPYAMARTQTTEWPRKARVWNLKRTENLLFVNSVPVLTRVNHMLVLSFTVTGAGRKC